jgi:hypothetical protein
MTQGKSKMSDISKTLFAAAASLATLILVTSSAHAQTAAFTGINKQNGSKELTGQIVATYTFNSSMIVNSIGMVDTNSPFHFLSYQINTGSFISVNPTDVSGNIRWYDFSTGLSLQQGDVLKIRTRNSITFNAEYKYDSFDLGPDVTFGGTDNTPTGGYTNGSIKVSPSNPGSNVAPEPGTFALALTGGGALLGICIRRRRNAG